eukprot:Protomagalhaensia_wolfi_Nauph_80__3518@NODE_356_length_2700_cov_103_092822_g268_i0_p2_GENE_NODE_356_length_2700_cov_103_092822_g268_i0NODE_356_length_2700_cov_103_092822_g268_i0_p2_ORF_typecomplete_len211_score19_14Peroxin22/PF12827_7/0_00038TssC/PF17541_2/0_0018_NODE_356_length_2700_cov_103_092822_g268_i0127759
MLSKLALLTVLWTVICLAATALYVLTQRSPTRTQVSANRPAASPRKKVVTIATNDIVISQDPRNGTLSLIQDSVAPLKELAAKHKIILISKVSSDEHSDTVSSLLESAGLVGPQLIEKHRVLFCDTAVGRSSMVRQIAPALHFESSVEAVVSLENRNVPFAFVNFVNPVADAKDTVLPLGVALPPDKPTVYHTACSSFTDCVTLFEGLVN